MTDIIGWLALIVAALLGIAVGAASIRDAAKGSAQSLGRMSTRVYHRRENPTAFWITIGTGLFWGLIGICLLALALGGLLDS